MLITMAALSLTLGAGKSLNNTNSRLPGYAGSAHLEYALSKAWNADIGYTRLGASQLGEDAAISTVGLARASARYSVSAGLITGASYSAAVWWDYTTPEVTYGVEGGGERYENDGTHFSRACHLCGGVVSMEYRLTSAVSIKFEYYGLRHLTPTFQGSIIQLTYRIGK